MKSIWEGNINLNTKFSTLEKDIETDVCIIGAGIAGISAAYELFKSGIKFTILEKDTVCSKTTKFSSAKITCQHGIIYNELIKKYGNEFAKLYLEANLLGTKNIKEIIKKENIDCDFKEEDSYVFTKNKKNINILKNEFDALRVLKYENAEFLDKLDINIDACAAIKFKNQGCFNPYKYTLSLANIIYKKNNNIYEHAKVIDIKRKSNKYIVYTENHTVLCKYVIITTHFPIKDIPGLYFLKMHQDTSYIIAMDIGKNKFDDMYINYEDPKISIRPFKQKDKTILLIGGNNNKTGDIDINKKYKDLEKVAYSLYPEGTILLKWDTEDCITLDKIPYIGKFSTFSPNILVATGFNKWGISTSNVASHIITDIIKGKNNKYEKIFKAKRYGLFKNIKNVYYMINQTFKSLILNKFKTKKESIESIPKGVGKIIKLNGKNIGIYKDENGKVYKVRPYCSHLKCMLTFNVLDKTWDCPCHGSRFDIHGKVINSPATKDITKES